MITITLSTLELSNLIEISRAPNREQDCLVSSAFSRPWRTNPIARRDLITGVMGEYEFEPDAAPYTASIDAAMTLVMNNDPSQVMHTAWRNMNRDFNLHISFWPENISYSQTLARYIVAECLRQKHRLDSAPVKKVAVK